MIYLIVNDILLNKKEIKIFTKKNTIEFCGIDEYVHNNLELPSPAIREIPKWYKDSTSFFDSNTMQFVGNDSAPSGTIKSCMPVLDLMTTGWIQKTWCDIYFEVKNGSLSYRYSSGPNPIEVRDIKSLGHLDIPEEYEKISFVWKRPWFIKTPANYSTIYTHPFYRTDLPFTSMSAIIDSDNYYANGKVAFFLRKGFSGLIPAGTPMYQIIPFKKDNWTGMKAKDSDIFLKDVEKIEYNIKKHFTGSYKKQYWNKKEYKNI